MFPHQIRIFYGQATDTLAEVYVELIDADSAPTRISGQIKGPYSSQARTLPSTTQLEPFDAPRLWRARIVDPCFWSLDHPSLYRVSIEIDGDRQQWSHFGIRRFGRDRQNLWLEGKRWVLRGAHWPESVTDSDLDEWREARLAMLVRDPPRHLCERASEKGIPLIVWLTENRAAEQLEAFSNCAAVCAGILDGTSQEDFASLRQAAPNILLGQTVSEIPLAPRACGADLFLCPPNPAKLSATLQQQPPCCVIAHRPVGSVVSTLQARIACEQLQRDLAPRFDLSGYLV